MAWWKLLLDITVIISVIAAVGFVAFVKQKEVYLYINMFLITVLCIVYWLYFSAMRKIDLLRWLERNRLPERPAVIRFGRNLRNILISGLPYWSLMYIYIIIMCLFFAYPLIVMTITWTHKDSVMPGVCAFLGALSTLYLTVIKRLVSDFKLRYRVKFHGGFLSIFIGIFLITSYYGECARFIGGLLTFGGVCSLYDVHWQYLCGANLRIGQEMGAPVNGNPGRRIQSHMSFLERVRRGLWYIIV